MSYLALGAVDAPANEQAPDVPSYAPVYETAKVTEGGYSVFKPGASSGSSWDWNSLWSGVSTVGTKTLDAITSANAARQRQIAANLQARRDATVKTLDQQQAESRRSTTIALAVGGVAVVGIIALAAMRRKG